MYRSDKHTLLLSTKAKGVVVHVDPTLIAETRTLAHIRIRFPQVRAAYERARTEGHLDQIYVLDTQDRKWIFFPISMQDSSAQRMQRVRNGLPKLAELFAAHQLPSVSMPALGCQHGLMTFTQIRKDMRSMFQHLHTTQVQVHHSCYFRLVKTTRSVGIVCPFRTPVRLGDLVKPMGVHLDGRPGRAVVLRAALRLGTGLLSQRLPPPRGAKRHWDDTEYGTVLDEPTVLDVEMALLDWLEIYGDDQPEVSTKFACRLALLLGLDALERRYTTEMLPMMNLPIVMPVAHRAEPLWVTLRTKLLGRAWSADDVSEICQLVENHYLTGRPALEDLVAPGLPVDSRNPADAIVWSYEREREVTVRRWEVACAVKNDKRRIKQGFSPVSSKPP